MNLLEAVKEVVGEMEADLENTRSTLHNDYALATKHYIRMLKMMVKMADVSTVPVDTIRIQGSANPVGVREVYTGEGDPPGYSVQPRPNAAFHGVDPWEQARKNPHIPHEPKAGER